MPYPIEAFAQSVLVNLDLDKVSLCNQGANTRAHILLTKRKENNEMPKTFEELMKALTEDQAAIVTAHLESLEKTKDDTIADLNKTVGELQDTVKNLEKAATEEKPVAKSAEDILKSASPEVAAYVESLQKSVNTLVADREEVIAKARFEEVKAIPAEEEELKSVLKSVSPAVYEILKKAATAIEEKVLTAKGKEGKEEFDDSADSAYASLEKSAKAISLEKGITFENAFMEACTNDPTTYDKYRKGVK